MSESDERVMFITGVANGLGEASTTKGCCLVIRYVIDHEAFARAGGLEGE